MLQGHSTLGVAGAGSAGPWYVQDIHSIKRGRVGGRGGVPKSRMQMRPSGVRRRFPGWGSACRRPLSSSWMRYALSSVVHSCRTSSALLSDSFSPSIHCVVNTRRVVASGNDCTRPQFRQSTPDHTKRHSAEPGTHRRRRHCNRVDSVRGWIHQALYALLTDEHSMHSTHSTEHAPWGS